MKAHRMLTMMVLIAPALAGMEPGDGIQVTLRGVEEAEQKSVNGTYRVGDSGQVRLPLLDRLVTARGLTPEQFARAAEAAYRAEGIYTKPAIEVEALAVIKDGQQSVVSVGGQVQRAGESAFRKGMTVIQAIDAAGGRNAFGGRNVLLIRGGRQYCIDFLNLKHKSIRLLPDDSLQVEQKGVLDRWKGSDEAVKPLLE
jgi:protein involved in polysaccharide export with SLBB domain